MSTPETTVVKRLRGKQAKLQRIKALFGSAPGQEVLRDLISDYCILTTFEADQRKSDWKQGQRDLVLMLAATVHSPDKYATQINEILQSIEEQRED